jgi:hypothetical protein
MQWTLMWICHERRRRGADVPARPLLCSAMFCIAPPYALTVVCIPLPLVPVCFTPFVHKFEQHALCDVLVA